MDDVEGDDDDDDLWDGWGEEVTAQDTTQNQIQDVLLGDANSTDLLVSNIADDKKKGGEGGIDYKNDFKSKLNYTNDRFHDEAGGEDDDDDIGEPEDDENCGILVSTDLFWKSGMARLCRHSSRIAALPITIGSAVGNRTASSA